ncbi:MAG: anthranilate phosphoribosyltransferase [Nitrososphaeria archaeon]
MRPAGEAIERALSGPLGLEEARELALGILGGELTDAQVAGILVALRARGEAPEELAGFAMGMMERALRISVAADLDIAGTGGDGAGTLNASTAAALLVAGPLRVFKHGNRSASGVSGSADFLEALGYNIGAGPEAAARSIEATGFAFAFAQVYHPAMRAVAGVRRQLGIRTIFNLLGPLTNPAAPRVRLIGVASPGLLRTMGEAAALQGVEAAALVHGEPGIDEVSPCGRTRMLLLRRGSPEELSLDPEDLGLRRVGLGELRVRSPAESAARFLAALRGRDDPALQLILANAGVALWVAGRASSPRDGVEAARGLLEGAEGRVRRIVEASWP